MKPNQKNIVNKLLDNIQTDKLLQAMQILLFLMKSFGKGLANLDLQIKLPENCQLSIYIYQLLGANSINISQINKIISYIQNIINQNQTNIYIPTNNNGLDGNVYITDIIGLQVQQGSNIYKRTLTGDLSKLTK